MSISHLLEYQSVTRLVCWSLAISKASFLNSIRPCPEFLESLFIATSCPKSSSTLAKFTVKQVLPHFSLTISRLWTLYTGPNLPSPSLFAAKKPNVAVENLSKLNIRSSLLVSPSQCFPALPSSCNSTSCFFLCKLSLAFYFFHNTYNEETNKGGNSCPCNQNC